MQDTEALIARSEELARMLTRMASAGKRIAVVTHIDADGLTSGAIAFRSLARKEASVSVRAVPDLDLRTVKELKSQTFDYHVFTDLGSGLVPELAGAFGDSFLVVDHHQFPESDSGYNIFNAWSFGFDGGKDVSSSTMSYLLARSLDYRNRDLSRLAVVGAVGDRQDSGAGRSLTALNRIALDDAVSSGAMTVSKDFLLHGRETRPVHEALAVTYSPLIPGLSGSKDGALAVLSNAGFKMKERGRWRTLSELSAEEKQQLLEVVARHVANSSSGSQIVAELIGEVYTFETEDSFTPLRDAREFATLLNACGRMDRADAGMAICIGDRADGLAEGLRTASEYRSKLSKAIQTIETEKDKVVSKGAVAYVLGDEFLEERLTGSVSSILASGTEFGNRVVLARARSGDSEMKFSARVGGGFASPVNLGVVMMECARQVGGLGGGHSMAAGAKVPAEKADEFMRMVIEKVSA